MIAMVKEMIVMETLDALITQYGIRELNAYHGPLETDYYTFIFGNGVELRTNVNNEGKVEDNLVLESLISKENSNITINCKLPHLVKLGRFVLMLLKTLFCRDERRKFLEYARQARHVRRELYSLIHKNLKEYKLECERKQEMEIREKTAKFREGLHAVAGVVVD